MKSMKTSKPKTHLAGYPASYFIKGCFDNKNKGVSVNNRKYKICDVYNIDYIITDVFFEHRLSKLLNFEDNFCFYADFVYPAFDCSARICFRFEAENDDVAHVLYVDKSELLKLIKNDRADGWRNELADLLDDDDKYKAYGLSYKALHVFSECVDRNKEMNKIYANILINICDLNFENTIYKDIDSVQGIIHESSDYSFVGFEGRIHFFVKTTYDGCPNNGSSADIRVRNTYNKNEFEVSINVRYLNDEVIEKLKSRLKFAKFISIE